MTLQELKTKLLEIMQKRQYRFAMLIETAFTIEGRGTVLSGWLMGEIGVGVSEGCLMDAAASSPLTDAMNVRGLERYKSLEHMIHAVEEPVGCGILVRELPSPESLAGMLFCGGERVVRTPDMHDMKCVLDRFREKNSNAFAMYVQDVYDMGDGNTYITGFMRGAAFAGRSTACFYNAEGEYALSEPLKVQLLHCDNREESILSSGDGPLFCGMVVPGRYRAAVLKGRLFIECSKMDLGL